MKKRRQPPSHQGQDQYGETGASQDREEQFGKASGGSLRGGGSAGGRQSARDEVVYERHIPKFLQEHMHHLEPEKQQTVTSLEDEEEQRLQDEQEAMNRALEEDPSLAKELNQSFVDKAKASQEKERGNEAYAKEDYRTAARHFSICIELDPTNEVYYSNRSAVYAAMKDYENAVRDAESVIRMKPTWVKGWARLAVANFGLGQYAHSKDGYDQALKLEPDDDTLITGRNKAEELERKQIQENKHTFNTSRKKQKKSPKKSGSSQKTNVSISYDDEDG